MYNKGFRFILPLYRCWGLKALQNLIGMLPLFLSSLFFLATFFWVSVMFWEYFVLTISAFGCFFFILGALFASHLSIFDQYAMFLTTNLINSVPQNVQTKEAEMKIPENLVWKRPPTINLSKKCFLYETEKWAPL